MKDHLSADELGRELRSSSSRFLKRRRSIIGLTFLSCSALGAIALYQMGLIKTLPGPRWRGFNAEKINGSAQAYSILSTPDALLGCASYALTATLAGCGPADRWKKHPLISVGLGFKVLADATLAGKLTIDGFRKFGAFSLWSLLVAATTWTAVPFAMPEAKAALHHLIGRRS